MKLGLPNNGQIKEGYITYRGIQSLFCFWLEAFPCAENHLRDWIPDHTPLVIILLLSDT